MFHQSSSDWGKYLLASNGWVLETKDSDSLPLSMGAKAARKNIVSENHLPYNIAMDKIVKVKNKKEKRWDM